MFERSVARLHRALRRGRAAGCRPRSCPTWKNLIGWWAIRAPQCERARDDAEVAKDVLGVRPGAAAARFVRRSSRSTSPRSRSRKWSRFGSIRSVEHVGEQRVERPLRDRAAAEPGDDVVDRRGRARTARAGRSGRRSRRRRPRTPSPRRPRRFGVARAPRGPRRAGRAGSSSIPTAPMLHALLAQLVDDVLDRAEHRAERDDDRLGVLAAVPAEQPAGCGRRPARTRCDLGDHVERLHLLGVHEVRAPR